MNDMVRMLADLLLEFHGGREGRVDGESLFQRPVRFLLPPCFRGGPSEEIQGAGIVRPAFRPFGGKHIPFFALFFTEGILHSILEIVSSCFWEIEEGAVLFECERRFSKGICFASDAATNFVLGRETIPETILEERESAAMIAQRSVRSRKEVLDFRFLRIKRVRSFQRDQRLLGSFGREFTISLNDPCITVVVLFLGNACEKGESDFTFLYLREGARKERL